MDHLCVTCGRSLTRLRVRHGITGEDLERRPDFADYVLQNLRIERGLLNDGQLMCHRCWVAAGRHEARLQQSQENHAVQQDPLPDAQEQPHVPNAQEAELTTSITISEYRRAPNTSNRCLFPHCHEQSLLRIPAFLKSHLLVENKLYIPLSARICQTHFDSGSWDELDEFNISSFTADQVTDMLNTLREATHRRGFNFDNLESISAKELHFCTALTHQEFNRLLQLVPSLLTRSHRPKTVLGAYLMKIRTGEPNERLSCRLNMSRRTFERKLEIAREYLETDFVLNHLGWNHISRQEIVARNLSIPSAIFGNDHIPPAIIICDGTYINTQKSSNFLFQKQSYSLHKYRNLLKPFMIVCTDGYIIDVVGPYAATTSDATIMTGLLEDETNPMHYTLQNNDVFILDRGFRDSIGPIETFGYEAHMPPTKSRNATQLSTDEANKSRLITIVRWVVEVINGRLKRDFKIFRQEYFNRAMCHMFTDIRIAAALLNTFRDPVRENPHADAIISVLNERVDMTNNNLAQYVIDNNMNRQRAIFETMTDESHQIPFPVLSEEDLLLIALGSYQIKLARSYLSEHIRNGVYLIEVCNGPIPNLREYGINISNGTLLRGRIQSRHVSNKIYYSYIIYNNDAESPRDAVSIYYCSCLTGARTIGACAHIMSIIWYLGWARHQPNILLPALFLDCIIVNAHQ